MTSRKSLILLITLRNIHLASREELTRKFKDEVAGRLITHFVGLRPKLYSFKVESTGGAGLTKKANEVRKCKGIKKMLLNGKSHLKTMSSVYFLERNK